MATQRFNTVWYLPQENKDRYLNILAGRVTGRLTVGANSIQFSGGGASVVITNILRVTFGKQGSDFMNDWVKIEYGQSATPSVAFFADASFFGWGGLFGGTQKIFDAVNRHATIRPPVVRAAPAAQPQILPTLPATPAAQPQILPTLPATHVAQPQSPPAAPAAPAAQPQSRPLERPRIAVAPHRVNRPAGVVLISIFDFLVALIGVFLGVVLFIFLSSGDPGVFPREFIAAFGALLAMVAFFFAAVAVILGWGIWKLKKWAWVVQLIFAAFGLMMGLSAAVYVVASFKLVGLFVALVRSSIDLLILWYLLRPHVRAAFWPLPPLGSPPPKVYPFLPPGDLR